MIYENGGRYFKMLKPPGSYPTRFDYLVSSKLALWQPVKKRFFFWVSDGEKFWLDMHGFHKTNL